MRSIDIHTHVLPPELPRWGQGFIRLERIDECRARLVRDDGALFREIGSNCWDPEVRLRCRRLLAPRDGLVADLAALWLLVGPEPDPPSLLGDEARRRRLAWWCWRLGVGTQVLPDGLPLPPADEVLYDEEWYDPPQALRHLRRLVRAGPPAR